MAAEDVIGRKLNLCPDRQQLPFSDLIPVCRDCGFFAIHCCQHQPCHHYRVVFTDGACLDNGTATARSGIGSAMGVQPEAQRSTLITNYHDQTGIRSNQRAELHAARAGLEHLREFHRWNKGHGKLHARGVHDSPNDTCFVIVTDSEYVVKGMTEWFPARNWRTAKGTRPANLDLFFALDAEVTTYEANGIPVAFLWVPRQNNAIADKLARDAADMGQLASTDSV